MQIIRHNNGKAKNIILTCTRGGNVLTTVDGKVAADVRDCWPQKGTFLYTKCEKNACYKKIIV